MEQLIQQWLVQQGPTVVVVILMWWYERRRADRLEAKLIECQDERADAAEHDLRAKG